MTSCHFFKAKEKNPTSKPNESFVEVARVGDKYLFTNDLVGLGEGKKDSAEIIKKYIRSWIQQQLILQKAEQNVEINTQEIERKVENYRYELMVYEYKQRYLSENLKTEVTEAEILKFYNENQDNFKLKQNIVKCHFLKLPKDASKLSKAKYWFKSTRDKDQNKIKEYAAQYSPSYTFDDSTWFNFVDVTKNTPFRAIANEIQYLKQHKFGETSDSTHVYWIKISDYKITEDISPIEFVKDQIRNTIVNRRKIELIKGLEEGIYKNAQQENEFEIYQ